MNQQKSRLSVVVGWVLHIVAAYMLTAALIVLGNPWLSTHGRHTRLELMPFVFLFGAFSVLFMVAEWWIVIRGAKDKKQAQALLCRRFLWTLAIVGTLALAASMLV